MKKNEIQELQSKIIQLEKENEILKLEINERTASEERYKNIFSHVPCTIYLCLNNPTFDMIFLNDQVEKLTGFPKEEFLSHKKSFVELYHSEDKDKIFEEADLRQKKTFGLIYRIWHKDGSLRWVEEKGDIIYINNKCYLQGFIIDITERIKFEKSLQQREYYLSSIIENQPGLVWLKDSESRFLAVNKSFAKSCGIDEPDQLVGKTDIDIWPPELAEKYREDDKSVMESKKSKVVEEQIVDQGKKIWFETFKTPVFNSQGEVIGTTGYARDITERIRTEKALRENEEIFKQFMENSPIYVHFKDENLRTLRLSKNHEKLTGKPFEKIIGKTLKEIFPLDFAEKIISDDMAILNEGKPITLDEEFNGRYYTTIKFPIKIEGKPRYIAGYTIDITDRKKTEEALYKVQKLESLGILAGGIAHDFNNLLGGIFGYIDLALIESSPENKNVYLESALAAIGRARSLTQQLLTFSKGGAPIKKIETFMPFIKETVQFALSGSSVSYKLDIKDDIWPCEFDKNQIGQVIDNIVINAQQAMPGGGFIEITAKNVSLTEKAHPILKAGNFVKFSIKDHGIGIPKKYLSRIFDPFFTTKPKGHGLGLATCFSIISRHEGTIEVESEPGKGSTFHIYLPASPFAIPLKEEKKAEGYQGNGIFLVMDDEELIRGSLDKMLSFFGFKPILTENGKSALDFFVKEFKAKRKIEGMIFDLTVRGGMGGKETISEIRKLDPDIPVFVSSGYGDDPVMANPQEYGFTASIRKPFTLAEFSRLLNQHMKKQ